MKKVLSIVVAVALMLGVFPFTAPGTNAKAAGGATVECTWSIDGTVLTISGNGPMECCYGEEFWGSVEHETPWSSYTITQVVIEDGVTTIGDYAFYECDSLTSVTIPNSVTSIGEYAFAYCDGLTSITIPNSVTSIGEYAFQYCSGLTTIPDSVTSIGNGAFYGCYGITSVTVPDGVTNIGDYVFFDCWNLKSIIIPDSVRSIGRSAFAFCHNLASVTIPNSIRSVDTYAFYNCFGLNAIYYRGSETDKTGIKIAGEGNEKITDVIWYYNSCVGSAEHTFGVDSICIVCGEELIREVYYTIIFKDAFGAQIANATVVEGELIDETAIPEAPARHGYVFIGWSYDFNQPIMNDVVATALYEKDITTEYDVVTEDEVEITLPEGQEKPYYNDRITLSAPFTNNAGQKFAYWSINGSKFSYKQSISFLVFDALNIEAVYADEAEENPVVIYTNTKANYVKDGSKWNMQVMGVVSAENVEVSEVGILLSASAMSAADMKAGYDANNGTVYKMAASSASNDRQFLYTVKGIAMDRTRCATVYAIIDGEMVVGEAVTCITMDAEVEYGGNEIIENEGNDPIE